MALRIIFMGTPDFSVPVLKALHAAGHAIVAVYSQPPRPAGRRGLELTPSPVHKAADALGISVLTPLNFKASEDVERFRSFKADVAVVVAYGLLLPAAILEGTRLGCYNGHASLLPRWRGAAPIQRAIMAGDPVTGVQVMRMSEGLDEGPILMSEQVAIEDDDTAATLHDKLAATGARLLPVALAAIERQVVRETPQAEDGVTYAKKIKSAEARIDWTRPAIEVDRHIRGLSPFPGAWFEAPSDKGPVRVKALLSRVEAASGAAGTALDDALLIACGEGSIRLLKAQREGKGVQDAETFTRGFPIPAGTVLA